MLCGVIPWRPHMLVTGAPGTGKSTLLELIMAIFGPDGMVSSDDATEAYIRQALDGARKPVALDEIENDPEGHKARQIIKLARNASEAREGGGGDRLHCRTARMPFAGGRRGSRRDLAAPPRRIPVRGPLGSRLRTTFASNGLRVLSEPHTNICGAAARRTRNALIWWRWVG